VAEPPWFARWLRGEPTVWITQDPECTTYGQYGDLVDARRLYSGLLAVPPGFDFNARLLDVLERRPLAPGHDGASDPSEQGCVAAACADLEVETVPLHQLPFARAFEDHLDFGPEGRRGDPWGYHFGRSFVMNNDHFTALVHRGEVFHRRDRASPWERYAWLRSAGDAVPKDPHHRHALGRLAARHRGRPVLQLETERGYLAAVLAAHGCRVTTVAAADHGAGPNLAGLDVAVVQDAAARFLDHYGGEFDLIFINKYKNSYGNLLRRSGSAPVGDKGGAWAGGWGSPRVFARAGWTASAELGGGCS
jgi:hypothetical protein